MRTHKNRPRAGRSCYARRVLKAGDRAPDFSAEATDGRTLTTAGLRGKPFVMYFFPKAFTTG
jgi:thioredoxin-dependent peroxiredoxin